MAATVRTPIPPCTPADITCLYAQCQKRKLHVRRSVSNNTLNSTHAFVEDSNTLVQDTIYLHASLHTNQSRSLSISTSGLISPCILLLCVLLL